jgi:hypothetical protein
MELCEQFYRSSTFIFADDDFVMLPRFRVIDRWTLGLPPMHFATKIHLHISCDRWCSKSQSMEEMWNKGERYQGMLAKETKHDLLARLELLVGFHPGTKIELYLHPACTARVGPLDGIGWVVEKVIPVILPTLDRYKTYGYLIYIAIQMFETFEVENYLSLDEWKAAFEQVRVYWQTLLNAQTNPDSSILFTGISYKPNIFDWRAFNETFFVGLDKNHNRVHDCRINQITVFQWASLSSNNRRPVET